jgi:hypothetical protein
MARAPIRPFLERVFVSIPVAKRLRVHFRFRQGIVCLGAFVPTLASAAAEEVSAVASIKDVDPPNIEVNIQGPNGSRSAGPGTSIRLGDTVSIAIWCQQHKSEYGHVVVIDRFGEERLYCGGKVEHTFTDRGTIIPQIQMSTPSKPTIPTITSQRPVAAPAIAVSPTHPVDQSTPATLPGKSPKIEDLLRKGDEPPSTK